MSDLKIEPFPVSKWGSTIKPIYTKLGTKDDWVMWRMRCIEDCYFVIKGVKKFGGLHAKPAPNPKDVKKIVKMNGWTLGQFHGLVHRGEQTRDMH